MNAKKFILSILFCAGTIVQAQEKSTLLSQDFWKSKPTLEQVKKEVSNGFDFKNVEGFNEPLLEAIMSNADAEVIQYLIDQTQTSLSKPFFHERTYLHLAASKNMGAVVEYLIKKGANINALDDKGVPPIGYAANSGNPEMIEIFIKNGVNLFQKFGQQNNADLLLLSVTNDKDLKITDYLLSKGFDINTKDKNGNGIFYYAALNGNHLDKLKKLIQKGVKYDDNALLAAAQGAHRVINTLEVYKYLIEELKLNPKVISKNGETLLHFIAAKPNQEEIIPYLINKGVDAKKVDNQGNTAFILASKGKSLEVVKSLFPYVQNVKATNKDGDNALLNAVKYSTAEIVGFLLEKGADIHFKDVKGNDLAYILVESYHPPRRGETKDIFSPKLQLLSSKGIDFSKKLNKGNTVYHIAATKNDLDLLRKLENTKANINLKNDDGLTALHKSALVAKDDKILKYLLSLGADKNIKTDFDETVYQLAQDNEVLRNKKVNIEFLK